MNFEGQNIGLQDALFVDNITGDIETFRVKSSSIARVLVFPPVNNYHRFLIHKVVETGFPQFTTFSVGEGADRRTVVCFQQHLLEYTLSQPQNGVTAEELKEEVVVKPKEKVEVSTPDIAQNTQRDKSEIIPVITLEDKPGEPHEVGDDEDGLNPGDDKPENSQDTVSEEVDPPEANSDLSIVEDLAKVEKDQTSLKEDPSENESMTIEANKEVEPSDEQNMNNNESSPEKLDAKAENDKKRRSKRPPMAVYVPPRARNAGPKPKSQPKPSLPLSSCTSFSALSTISTFSTFTTISTF